MKEILVDFSDSFTRNIATSLGIPTDENYITSEQWVQLQGNISSCLICYHFSKMHMLVIKNALEKKLGQNGNYKRLDDETVHSYIKTVEEERKQTGDIPIQHMVVPTMRLTEENYNDYCQCVAGIDSEFSNHQELIQVITQKPIEYLEQEIINRKYIHNYKSLEDHLNCVGDYYRLQDIGIEGYLQARRGVAIDTNSYVKK